MADIPSNNLFLQLTAGVDQNGQQIVENVEVQGLEKTNHYKLVKSPLFLRNLAAGDIFTVSKEDNGDIRVLQRSGNLCIRVFRRENIEELELRLSPEVEKLDGRLDIHTERALVYSIHVNIGFGEIETLFDSVMSEFTDSVWYYGNIYDPRDGVTPLNWWDEFINSV